MNDRLKFRAWGIKENKYFYDVEDVYDYMQGLPFDCFGDLIKDENYVIEQSTGLKDKNGKLIFEGDIIKITRGGTKKQSFCIPKIQITDVYYDKGAFRYRWGDGSGSVIDFNSVEIVKGSESITQNVEVIGNIHQNSHLLGGK